MTRSNATDKALSEPYPTSRAIFAGRPRSFGIRHTQWMMSNTRSLDGTLEDGVSVRAAIELPDCRAHRSRTRCALFRYIAVSAR